MSISCVYVMQKKYVHRQRDERSKASVARTRQFRQCVWGRGDKGDTETMLGMNRPATASRRGANAGVDVDDDGPLYIVRVMYAIAS